MTSCKSHPARGRTQPFGKEENTSKMGILRVQMGSYRDGVDGHEDGEGGEVVAGADGVEGVTPDTGAA